MKLLAAFLTGAGLVLFVWDFTLYADIEAGVFNYRAAGYRIVRITP